MATKKAVSTKKTSVKKTVSAAKPSTKTTTVKAVSSSASTSYFADGRNLTPVIGSLVAEFIGTFLLAASYIDLQGSPLYVAFVAIGIVLLVGGLSGSHFNPAVTIGAWVTRRITWRRTVGYIVAQVLGAGAAFAVLSGFLKATSTTTSTTTAPVLYHAAAIVSGKEWYLFFAELLGTLIVAFAVATAINRGPSKFVKAFTIGFGTLIGLAIAVSATSPLLTAASTGFTILNPAIAVSLSALDWKVWPIAIYVLAPFIGGVLGFLLQGVLKSVENKN
jgi:aquaporin Z